MDDSEAPSLSAMTFALLVLCAALTAVGGGFAFDRGLDARAAIEPDRLVALGEHRGLIPGLPEASITAEIRSTALAIPAPHVARTGRSWRTFGCALMAAGLGLAFVASLARARRSASATVVLPRVLWLVPGVCALFQIATSASADAPTVAIARDVFESWLPALGLSFLLLAAWRA